MKERIDRQRAYRIAYEAINLIESAFVRIDIAGSIRRKKATVADIEIVGIPESVDAFKTRTDNLLAQGVISKHDYSPNQPEYSYRWGDKYRGFDFDGMLVEVFCGDRDNIGYIEWLRTGPGDKNTAVMTYLSRKFAPVRMKDGYVWHVDYPYRDVNNSPSDFHKISKLQVPDEQTMYQLLNIPYHNPEQRDNEHLLMKGKDWEPPTLETILSLYAGDTPKQMSMF